MRHAPSLPLAAVLSLGLAACVAPEASAPSTAPAGNSPLVKAAPDSYFLRMAGGDMSPLRQELARRGITTRHEYSDAVGLADTVAVNASAAQVRELLAALPQTLQVHADVLRYPLDTCGDGTCGPDEEANDVRTSTCSFDCGVPSAPEKLPELTNSWQVPLIGADSVWSQTQGAGVDVAILDTGYDRGAASTHPDHPKNLGYSYNFAGQNSDFSDVGQHGTHVTGIVAAAHNSFAAVGVAPDATIHMFAVFTNSGGQLSARSSDIIAGVQAAIANKYRIISMSLGGPSDSAPEHQALQQAYVGGLLPVAAAGNTEDATNGDVLTAPSNFPGAYPEVLSVGATTQADVIASYSATGSTLIVSAPGSNVYSSVPVNTGTPEATVTFHIPGVGLRALASVSAPGGSRTPLRDAQVVACGLGSLPEIMSCQPNNMVALIKRGPADGVALTFEEKIDNARLLGAIGVILYNHRDGDATVAGDLLDDISLGTVMPVPVYTLAAGDGEYLVAATERGTVTVSAQFTTSDFAVFSGTSMATPVVAASAALLWAKDPALSNVAVRQLLAESAVDLGPPGRDDTYGWGRVDVARAFAQGLPRARCGDGQLDRASEICDGTLVGSDSCDGHGWDSVPGAQLGCNATCTAVSTSSCQCVPGRAPFTAMVSAQSNVTQAGQTGTLITYSVLLMGSPVAGATASVSIEQGGQVLLTYSTSPSNAQGQITDFIPTVGTGNTPGTYQIVPVITKGMAQCHPNSSTTPSSLSVMIQS